MLYIHCTDVDAQIILPATIGDSLNISNTDSFYLVQSNVTVQATGKLVIEKGVTVKFNNGTYIYVNGLLKVNGTENNKVLFTVANSGERWKYINANNGDLDLNYLDIRNAIRFVTSNYGNISILNCTVDETYGTIGDDCIGVHYASKLLISGCKLNGNPERARIDAMDCDAIDQGEISNNIIQNFEDDGIDIGTGTKNILIYNNTIDNCNFGISVGENSEVTAIRNVLLRCDAGIQSHSGSNVKAYNNTLYNNQKGVECHHGGAANSGGTLLLNSCIISQTKGTLFTIQDNSSIKFEYSLCDTDSLTGDSNLFGNPLFLNTDTFNFKLSELSPCINSGDPILVPIDNDSTRIDIGAFEYLTENADTIPDSIPDTDTLVTESIDSRNSEMKIYPNPVKSEIFIKNLPKGLYDYQLFSISGSIAQEGGYHKDNPIDISGLKPGIYLLRLSSNNKSFLTKVYKTK